MIRILTSLVVILTITPLQAQVSSSETPKLVIGITIDQLRGDYLEHFKHAFGEKGFKRLLSEGLVYQNMEFDFDNINEVSALATIYTGSNPISHGIVSPKYYSAKTHREEPIFADNNYIGNYTSDKVSPIALKGTTITDELKIASDGRSDVYSFAANSEQALITAGRAGNTAYWIDEYTGKWASTTFYKDFYWTVDQDNRKTDNYTVKTWGAIWSSSQNQSLAFPYTKTEGGFQHSLGANKDTYKLSKKTPFANENIRETAINLISKADLGKRSAPDFISLTFYAGKYPKAEDYGAELKDTYVRLDKDIELLLTAIDQYVGLQNVLIFVSSTGYFESETPDPDRLRSNGAFYANRCEALLNMYLMAIYGQNQKWVDKYHDKQLYLNRELIKSKDIKLKEIQAVAAEFVAEFTGVQAVYTQSQLFLENTSNQLDYIKNGLSAQLAGDLVLELQSGFTVIDEQDTEYKEKVARYDMVACPVIFFGHSIKAEKIRRVIKATEIAPSIAYIMRIRAPSAARNHPLVELQ